MPTEDLLGCGRELRHVGKSESFHIVEGEVDVAVFDEAGTVVEVIEPERWARGRNFYYRLSESAFHTLLIRTEFLVIHEVTNGPFDRDRTVLAPFAPPEDKPDHARDYLGHVSDAVARHLEGSRS